MKPSADAFVVHRSLPRYGLAVLCVGIALGVAILLEHFHFRSPATLLLMLSVAIASWYGGRGPGVMAGILSTVAYYWYFVEPVRTIYIYWSEIPRFITFVAFTVLLLKFGAVRRRVEAGLRERAALLDLTHDTVFVIDMDGVIKYWNRGAEERYGWPREEAVGRFVHGLLETVFPAPLEELKAEITRTGRWEGELRHTRKDGTHLVVASRWSLERDNHGAPLAILETNNDITERKRAEEALRRLNRELRAISNCNQTLLRATDEQSLLNEICRIACEEAGYRMAFVAFAEHDEAKTVRPVAWTGAEEGYLATAGITWADTERGRGPTGTAIRSGKTCCIQDFAADPRMAPWREGLLQQGYRSGIAVPLKDEQGHAFGSLTIHSAQPDAFTPEEIRLLEELAGDMAFGIVNLRSQAARKRAEQEVTLLSFALDHVREAAYLIDESGRYCYVNEEACRVLGYPRAQLRGISVADIDPDFPAERWTDHWRELKEQRSLSFESRHRTQDGRIFPVEISANYFEYGGRAYNLGMVRDITERKQAEEALRRSEAYLAEAQRLSHIGSWAYKHGTDKPSYWSDELFRIWGFDPKEGPPNAEMLRQRIHPDDRIRTFEVRDHALQAKTDFECEFRIVLPDGAVRYIRVLGHPVLDASGELVEVIGTHVDVTERKRAEQERERLRKLETDLAHVDRVNLLGELAASISHELIQPIAASMINASLALQLLEHDPPDLTQARQRAARIIEAGTMASEIIDHLRSLYRKEPPRRGPLTINEVIGEMVELLRGEATRHAVSVHTDLADSLPLVIADRVQIQQVLMNLMLNSIEAMSETGGVLTVKSQRKEIGEIEISVNDTGPGLPPGKAGQIFDAFFTTKTQGSGMGLAISKSIVESHGGRIWANGNGGRGATFNFTLPAAPLEESLPSDVA
jgi:PAS domain S-box-containing protein